MTEVWRGRCNRRDARGKAAQQQHGQHGQPPASPQQGQGQEPAEHPQQNQQQQQQQQGGGLAGDAEGFLEAASRLLLECDPDQVRRAPKTCERACCDYSAC